MYPFDVNLIKGLNLKRIVNFLKVTISYWRHSLLIDFGISGLPPVLSIEPTNLCNLHCLQCPSGKGELKRDRGMMDISLFKKIIDTTKNHLIYLLLYFQGEPMLNRNIISMIEYVRRFKIYVVMNTNGHYIKTDNDAKNLINSGLNGIIFSIDGATEESYKVYRAGGNFNTVLDGIRRLIETKQKMKSKSPKVYLQFIVMKHNQSEIEQIKRLGKSLNVDKVFLKSVQIYDENDYTNLLPSMEKFRRYNKINGSLVLKKETKNHCRRVLFSSVVTWDGKVLPCCFDKDARFSLGRIDNSYSFNDIWNSKKSVEFRKKVFTERDSIFICRNCIE